MNEQQLSAVKQALEALEMVAARTGARWALEQGYAGHLEAITTLQSIISQDALDKMAENARELGLSYEPAQQEPVAQCTNSDTWNCKYCRKTETCEALEDPRNFATPPAAQPAPWVGLSEDEINKLRHLVDWTAEWSYGRFAYELERLLREKNT
jgi:hypothetical protein